MNYLVFLRLAEAFVYSLFVYFYYSISKKDTFFLYGIISLIHLFINNKNLCASLCFIITILFFVFEKRKPTIKDILTLALYYIFVGFLSLILHSLHDLFLVDKNQMLERFFVGFFENILLFIMTMIIGKYKNHKIRLSNKEYIIMIFIGSSLMATLLMVFYSAFQPIKIYTTYLIGTLLTITFIMLCYVAVVLNNIYDEKSNLEKIIEKQQYIKQNLYLIENISYEVNRKEHFVYWVLETIKRLNNKKNPDIDDHINKVLYRKRINVYTKNPVFDTILTLKLNDMILKSIDIKPMFEIQRNDSYNEIEFVNTISNILSYVQKGSSVTLHVKDLGSYVLVELFSLDEFYNEQYFKEKTDLIFSRSKEVKDGIYFMKFLIKSESIK